MFKNLNKKGGVFKTSSANAKRKQYIAYQNYLIKRQQMFQQQMFQQQNSQQQKSQQQNSQQQKSQHANQIINNNSITKELNLIFNSNKIIPNKNKKNNEVAYIILYRENDSISDLYRLRNLYYTILLTGKLFNFNIYITEIGKSKSSKLAKIISKFKNFNIKHNFILNNKHYFDRAHGFNCTIKHFIGKEHILIMGDCDLPLKQNIQPLIHHIKTNKYYFISPYNVIEKLDNHNTTRYCNAKALGNNGRRKSNLFTISGGILIANREIFEKLGLWFEYMTYGCEDRALDVILLEKYKAKTFIDNYNYIHLWHPTDFSNINYFIMYKGVRYTKADYHKLLFNCFDINPKRKSAHSTCKHNHENIWGAEYSKQNKGDLNKYK